LLLNKKYKSEPGTIFVFGSLNVKGVTHMNKDQAKGIAKDIVGKVQETAGEVIGSKSQQVKGLNKQIEGKVQKAFGDVKETVKDITKKDQT